MPMSLSKNCGLVIIQLVRRAITKELSEIVGGAAVLRG